MYMYYNVGMDIDTGQEARSNSRPAYSRRTIVGKENSDKAKAKARRRRSGVLTP